MAKDTRWDQNLSVAADADGLIGHAGAVLLRKLADQCGLTSGLGAALGRKGNFSSCPSARCTRFEIAMCTCSCGSPSRLM